MGLTDYETPSDPTPIPSTTSLLALTGLRQIARLIEPAVRKGACPPASPELPAAPHASRGRYHPLGNPGSTPSEKDLNDTPSYLG